MYLLGLGLIFAIMKYLEINPVVQWSWLTVLTPFGLAVVWWTWADWSGYTKRKAMEREDKRKAERMAKTRENLGLEASKRGNKKGVRRK